MKDYSVYECTLLMAPEGIQVPQVKVYESEDYDQYKAGRNAFGLNKSVGSGIYVTKDNNIAVYAGETDQLGPNKGPVIISIRRIK